jgi:hypothetical protein
LGVEREGTQRHVAVLVGENHGLHSGNFGDGELARAGAGTRRPIVEGAGCRRVAPSMVASRFEAENPEDQAKGQPRSGTLDGAEDVRLGGALRQASAVDDWVEAAPLPGRNRGTGDGEAMAQRTGTRAHHVLTQAMVVGAARTRSWRRNGHDRRRILRSRGRAGRKAE